MHTKFNIQQFPQWGPYTGFRPYFLHIQLSFGLFLMKFSYFRLLELQHFSQLRKPAKSCLNCPSFYRGLEILPEGKIMSSFSLSPFFSFCQKSQFSTAFVQFLKIVIYIFHEAVQLQSVGTSLHRFSSTYPHSLIRGRWKSLQASQNPSCFSQFIFEDLLHCLYFTHQVTSINKFEYLQIYEKALIVPSKDSRVPRLAPFTCFSIIKPEVPCSGLVQRLPILLQENSPTLRLSH